MVPQFYVRQHPDDCSLEEFKRLLAIRLETLQDATRAAFGGQPLPIPWRTGWSARLAILGRDRDGSLRAKITVKGPAACHGYVRKVRLCHARRVNV